MKEKRGGGRSTTHPRTKLKIKNLPMLDTLLKIKPDSVVATWYLTAATQLLYWAEMRLCPYALSIRYIQKHPTMEGEFVAHHPFIGYVTK